jgi:hypothetical protein
MNCSSPNIDTKFGEHYDTKIGGKIIASGGFGCVFLPALRCKGNKTRSANKVSKLMTIKNAKEEYGIIKSAEKKLKKIPNYQDYFVISDATICKPEKLTESDLFNFDKKCRAIIKKNITKNKINKSLDKLLLLNIPNAGIPVDDYINQHHSFSKISLLYEKLRIFLMKAIIPMNNNNIYHSDIKDSNVLVMDTPELKTRLIDWGLVTQYIPLKKNPFPREWKNRPFQFNVPFSIILFSDVFDKEYKKYLQNGGKMDNLSLYSFTLKYIHLCIKERGSGHYNFINEIMVMLFEENEQKTKEYKNNKSSNYDIDKAIEKKYTLPYISLYLIRILQKYTNKDGFQPIKYLDDVFVNIIDIYGYVCLYFPLLELFYQNKNSLSKEEKIAFTEVKKLFITYLFNPQLSKYNMPKLTQDLLKIENMLSQLGNQTRKKITINKKYQKTRKNRNDKTIVIKQ